VPQSHTKNHSKIILVGEDDPDDQEFLKEIFATVDSSYSLIFGHNGSQILLHLNTCKDADLPCLILLDYNMPELNGAEILTELKKDSRYNKIPKIIWSTSSSQTYKDMCLELGANDYVVKPSSMNALQDIARQIIVYANT
jgi:CheY-like chemotaxis protein